MTGLPIPHAADRTRAKCAHTNVDRRVWLLLSHCEREYTRLARAGRYGLAQAAEDATHVYRDMLGLPSTKGYEP